MFLKLVKLQNGTSYNEEEVNIFSLNGQTQPFNTKAIVCLAYFDKLFIFFF